MQHFRKYRLVYIILILLILAGVLVFLFSRSEEESPEASNPAGYGNVEIDPEATVEPATQEALSYLLETPNTKIEIDEIVNEQVKSAMQDYENITQQDFQCISRMAGVKVDNQYLCLELSQQDKKIVVDAGILMRSPQ